LIIVEDGIGARAQLLTIVGVTATVAAVYLAVTGAVRSRRGSSSENRPSATSE
jgi:hypothetical protein